MNKYCFTGECVIYIEANSQTEAFDILEKIPSDDVMRELEWYCDRVYEEYDDKED